MPQAKYPVVVRFKKTDIMRYISHLDLLRLFQRASRRAGLPLFLTEGFNPHPKIKIEPALKLGLEADDLRAEIILTQDILRGDVLEKLEKELPRGIKIMEVEGDKTTYEKRNNS
ncbi:MAG: TIGR03936 family radical SAM-associated protein [Candidatus Omnitrophota bacterium]